jgi:hypothetical protein
VFGDLFTAGLAFARSYFRLMVYAAASVLFFGHIAYSQYCMRSLESQNRDLQDQVATVRQSLGEAYTTIGFQNENMQQIVEYCQAVKCLDLRDGAIKPEEFDAIRRKLEKKHR